MAELERVRVWAEALLRLHLNRGAERQGWSFGFDHAKTRAGQCDHGRRRITVSRHIAQRADDDEIHQVLLHEVAHALAGPEAGHGPRWRSVAAELGYEGSRVYRGASVEDLAPWVGTCPRGHVFYRHRRPTRRLSCSACSRGFSAAHEIVWRRRAAEDAAATEPTASGRRAG